MKSIRSTYRTIVLILVSLLTTSCLIKEYLSPREVDDCKLTIINDTNEMIVIYHNFDVSLAWSYSAGDNRICMQPNESYGMLTEFWFRKVSSPFDYLWNRFIIESSYCRAFKATWYGEGNDEGYPVGWKETLLKEWRKGSEFFQESHWEETYKCDTVSAQIYHRHHWTFSLAENLNLDEVGQ